VAEATILVWASTSASVVAGDVSVVLLAMGAGGWLRVPVPAN
jgi:hypothetical protein